MRTKDYKSFAITFIFYLIFVPAISSIMLKIMYVTSNSMQIINGVERMDEVLYTSPLPSAVKANNSKGSDILFQDVSFSYSEASETKALNHVSFHAGQGQITAVVGPSGGGKSTIAHLIPRFFDVTEGSIKIGGVDIRDMELSKLMDKVSFVFQDVFLFKQSIMDNIRIGNLEATDAQVIEAAKAAQCHEFIEKLPQGYQTVIGSKGVHLSGGERQRLVIARAIVKDAPIIVLDEATAFADPENEYLIQKAFERLMKKKTVIIIAHRLSTIRSAGNILVMDKGVLVESGNHEALIAKKGKYFEMWQMYTKSLDWKMGKAKEAENHA
jgi:ATP-binding cassette subfamily B protein